MTITVSSRIRLLAAIVALVATIAAYLPSMQGPFVWDDLSEIADNPAIRTLLPLWRPLFEGGDLPHRPVPYLTFAGNYAFGRLLAAAGIIASPLDTLPFHVVNVAIHLLNGWLLYWIVCRVLVLRGESWHEGNPVASAPGFLGSGPRLGSASVPLLAWLAATLWLVHPLESQAVSYIYQRIELLAACASLATLAAFLRAATAPRPLPWGAAAVGACAIGMGCKEWVVVMPLVVLLADRAFLASSWHDVFSHRGAWHAALFATIPIALVIVAAQRSRYPEAGFTAWQSFVYAVNQPAIIFWYLSRLVLPWGQSLDHGGVLRLEPFGRDAWLFVPAAITLAAAGWAAWNFSRRPTACFAILSFLLLLAPTSSLVPVQDACVEHRMYLASAIPIAAVVAVVGGRLITAGRLVHLVAAGSLAVLVLTGVTFARNTVYRSAVSVWQDAAMKNSGSSRSLSRLGAELSKLDRHADALRACEAAVKKNPANPVPFAALAAALLNAGRPADAERVCRAGLATGEAGGSFADPVLDRLSMYRGVALDRQGDPSGEPLLRAAVARRPDSLPAREHLARCLVMTSPRESAALWASLLAESPADAYVLFNLGSAVARFDPEQAVGILRAAVAADPANPDAFNNLGGVLVALGRRDDAARAFEACLRIAPAHPQAAANLRGLADPQSSGVNPP